MQQHVKIVAILSIIFGACLALVGALIFTILFGAGAISGDEDAMLATGAVGTIVGGFFVVLSLPAILGGIGLLKYRNWARILILIVAVLSVLNFPIGTAYGVYALYVLLNNEAQPLFAAAPA